MGIQLKKSDGTPFNPITDIDSVMGLRNLIVESLDIFDNTSEEVHYSRLRFSCGVQIVWGHCNIRGSSCSKKYDWTPLHGWKFVTQPSMREMGFNAPPRCFISGDFYNFFLVPLVVNPSEHGLYTVWFLNHSSTIASTEMSAMYFLCVGYWK